MTQEEKNTEAWYEVVEPDTSLTQGDIILLCPLIGWNATSLQLGGSEESDALKAAINPFTDDVVVMTQACDLENNKVSSVVLCPCISLTEFRRTWEEDMRQRGHNPSPRAWRAVCEDITNGFIWNFSMLNSCDGGELTTEHRIVDFHEIFTVPREFLESFLKQRGQRRLRLRPPYREHLSQAFARFFMRVGLPSPVEQVWEK